MRRKIRQIVAVLGIGAVLAGSLPAGAQDAAQKAIGFYMTVIGKTTVAHAGRPPVTVPVKLRANVYFKDVIETQAAARAKALFDDDSLLTVGENSRVEINEYTYDPARNLRSAVLRLVQGKARALVGKLMVDLGSKFEVHTPTAVTAARGTYFVVWVEGQSGGTPGRSEARGTGIVNIGGSGIVAFTSGGRTVDVPPQTFSFAKAGDPPSPPAPLSDNVPASVTAAIAGTEVADTPTPESSGQMAAAVGQAPSLLVAESSALLSTSNLSTLTLQTSTLASVQASLTPPPVVSGSGLNAVIGTLGVGGGLPGTGGICVGSICLPPLP